MWQSLMFIVQKNKNIFLYQVQLTQFYPEDSTQPQYQPQNQNLHINFTLVNYSLLQQQLYQFTNYSIFYMFTLFLCDICSFSVISQQLIPDYSILSVHRSVHRLLVLFISILFYLFFLFPYCLGIMMSQVCAQSGDGCNSIKSPHYNVILL